MVMRVAGVSHRNDDGTPRQDLIRFYVVPGAAITLVREERNAYSSTAVAILVKGKQIGYVPEDYSRRIAEYLDGGFDWTARVLDIGGGKTRKPTLGVAIEAAFWRGIEPREPFREGYNNNNASRVARGLQPFDLPRQHLETDSLLPGVRNPVLIVMIFALGTIAAAFLLAHW